MSFYSRWSVYDATGQSTQHTVGAYEPFETGGKSVHNLSAIAVPPAYTHPFERHSIPNKPLLLAALRSIRADSRNQSSSSRLFELWG
jgi:hypothetical protein